MAAMKSRTAYESTLDRRSLSCVAAVLALVFIAGSLGAQTVPTGVQEYFVLGWEQHLWDMMATVQAGEGGPTLANGMNSVVTATASADNQIIYYDHWEDGLDPGLAGFPDSIGTLQSTTLVIGDGDNTNGDACNFNTNILPCPSADVLAVGDYVNFNSDQGLACGTPDRCSVPLNNRCAAAICTTAEIRYDGGDLIKTTGGPLSVIHNQWPLTQYIGGATEILPRQAVEAARSYSVPIGVDLHTTGTVTEPFKYVELELVAFEETGITVESPGAGSVSFTLTRGQHWSSQGFIDSTPTPTTSLTINAGTKVSTTSPISGMIFTGGDGTWATRHFALLPDILHSTDYVTTAPGDDPTTNGDRPANIYILNPDQLSAIDVNITDSSGTFSVNLPANSMRSMQDITPTGRDIAPDSTVRITSDRTFWGITAYDYGSPSNDWGHSWLAKKFLTRAYTVGHAPQNSDIANQPDLFNPVYVAATADNTLVYFDLDNDGVYDQVDLNGDGVADSDASTPDNSYRLNTPSALMAFEPNPATSDREMTGTRIIANKPIAVSWGQETDLAPGGSYGLDTGYTVYPVQQAFLDPALTIEKTADTTVVPIAGDDASRTVTYTLTVRSHDFGPLTNARVLDLLPAGILGTAYVTDSTLITYPNLVQDDPNPTVSTDLASGRTILEWDLTSNPPYEAGDPPFSFGADQTLTVEYQVVIPAAPSGTPRRLLNRGSAEASLGGSVFTPTDIYSLVQTDVVLEKAVDETEPGPGDILTFTLTVTNNSASITETNVLISDAIPDDTTYCDSTIDAACSDPTTDLPSTFTSGAFDAGQNTVEWTAASFAPGQTANLEFQVKVNPQTPAGTQIYNSGGYESLQTPYFLSNEVVPVVQGSALTSVKSIAGSPVVVHPNQIVTFDVLVDNTGSGAASNVIVSDPFPANASYVPGSMSWSLNSMPFVPLTDANDGDEGGGADGRALADRIEFRLAGLGASQNAVIRFQVTVDPGTADQYLNNQATFASDETPSTDTNLVQVPIIGDADVTGHVFLDSNGNGSQDPGEPNLANIDVVVTDATGAVQTVTTDSSGNYLVTVAVATTATGCYRDEITNVAYNGSNGSLSWTSNPWTEYGNGADTNTGTDPMSVQNDPITGAGNNVLRIRGVNNNTTSRGFTRAASLNPGEYATLTFRYTRQGLEVDDIVDLEVDYGSGSGFQLLDSFGQPASGAQGDSVWLAASYSLDPAELPANTVVFRWSTSSGYGYNTDQFYFDDVEICVNEIADADVTLDVDETDPDFPPGATLTTGNDSQTVTAVPNGTVASGDVGYQLPALTFTKTSDPIDHEVSPGQTITYTLEATNNSGSTQTGITIVDDWVESGDPDGTSYVAGSTNVSGVGAGPIRVTEYFLGSGTFSGTTQDLTLDQDLASDYFVILQGSDGDGSTNLGPDENYARLTQDPNGTGELTASSDADVIRLERGNAVNSWVGVVTVVECVRDCDAAGFRLRDVRTLDHTGTATAGNEASTWTDIDQVVLFGGANGSGCRTTETSNNNTKVCDVRIFPTDSPTRINWTRDPGGGATLSTSATTVAVVEWGSEWTIQRQRVQGNNGGGGADEVGEYNTAAISAVARANTWVWGVGHTNNNGIGDGGEGCLITLGNGVAQNATESSVAVGIEHSGRAVDFEVYALTHPELAVDQVFKIDGDGSNLTVDVTVDAAGPERLAFSTNGMNGTGGAFPRPMFSARYINDTTVRLERQRSGQDFPSWVQGIDFSAMDASPASGGVPPNLVTAGDGYSIPPNETLTVTFQVVVDDPLSDTITEITNNARLTTDTFGPADASVTDDVVLVGVVTEYDNAGFEEAGATIVYAHEVTNTGNSADSFDITVVGREGWAVQLIDPGSGAVIATDSNADGVWDGGETINTGTLAAGESLEYELRVMIPSGASTNDAESTAIRATSNRNPAVSDLATDETVVVGGFGPVIMLPDNSGVGISGGSVVYNHRVINNTGATDTFDLVATSLWIDPDTSLPAPWPATFYWDSNGDGTYTDGVDIAITNTRQLADGEWQDIFLVIDVPGGLSAGTVDVAYLSAVSRNDPDNLFATATDTTTIDPPTHLDLSGGGTRSLDLTAPSPETTGIFPGVLRNYSDVVETYNFTISPSWFDGLDSFDHPTELWADLDGNGTYETELGSDDDGDGVWDTYVDSDGDSRPDVELDPGDSLSYELRRSVDPGMHEMRDPVTLTAFPTVSGQQDSVTATLLVAAATAAVLADFDAVSVNGQVVVEWRTTAEFGTLGFDLFRRAAGDGGWTRVNPGIIQSLRGSLQGGIYRYLDSGARPGTSLTYRLEERDIWGGGRTFGPFEVTPEPTKAQVAMADALSAGVSRTPNTSRIRRPGRTRATKAAGQPSGWVKIVLRDSGLVEVSAAELATVFAVDEDTIVSWIANHNLRISVGGDGSAFSSLIFADGFESGGKDRWGAGVENPGEPEGVAWKASPGNTGVLFYAQALDSIYTLDAVYWMGVGPGSTMASAPAGPSGPPAEGSFAEELHFEIDNWPVTAPMTDPESDYWMWELLFPWDGEPTDSQTFTINVPNVAATAADAALTLHLQGSYESETTPNHQMEVRLNGNPIGGTMSWSGHDQAQFTVDFPQALLLEGDNTVEVLAHLVEGLEFDEFYLDSFDLSYRRMYVAREDALEGRAETAEVTINGFSSPEITVLDLTDPLQPIVLTGLDVTEVGGSFRVTFATTSPGMPFLATAGAAAPHEVRADLASDLRMPSHRGAYVVVAGPGLESEAAALAAYREARGLSTVVARVEDVYDEFNGGLKSPWAIRDFLQFAAENWAEPPLFAFLAGDGSLDHHNLNGLGEDLIPMPLTSSGDGLIPADNLLADWIGDDGVPELAIGRLPAQSAGELALYRAKVEDFEEADGDFAARSLWIADNSDEGGEFVEDIEALIDASPGGFAIERIFIPTLGPETARAQTLAWWSEGARMVTFLGHGGPDGLAYEGDFEGLLLTGDVAAIDNEGRTPFFSALTCIVGRFDFPGFDILTEALLIQGGGGAIGAWAPSGFSMNADAVLLGMKHQEALSGGTGTTVGESVRSALAAYAQDPESDPDLAKIFILFGDPALRLD